MPPELIQSCIKGRSSWEQLCFYVVYFCAPVFRGVKVSNLIVMPKGMWLYLFNLFHNTGLCCKVLETKGDKECIFIYRMDQMECLLENREVQNFISDYGYCEMGFKQVFKRLQRRCEEYAEGNRDYPHELGVFLGYPTKDVRSFIDNKGKNFYFNGYWKVYHNPKQAAALFQVYDSVRKDAVREFVKSKDMSKIIKKDEEITR